MENNLLRRMNMSTKYWEASITELLEEYNIDLGEKMDDFISDVQNIAEMESEACGYINIPNPKNAELEDAKRQIKNLEAQVEKEREDFRKNVALRRHCSPEDVTLEGGGHATVRL